MPLRDKINQPNEYCWFTNIAKAEELGRKGVLVLFNPWWVHRIHGTNRIKQVKILHFTLGKNLSKQEIH